MFTNGYVKRKNRKWSNEKENKHIDDLNKLKNKNLIVVCDVCKEFPYIFSCDNYILIHDDNDKLPREKIKFICNKCYRKSNSEN